MTSKLTLATAMPDPSTATTAGGSTDTSTTVAGGASVTSTTVAGGASVTSTTVATDAGNDGVAAPAVAIMLVAALVLGAILGYLTRSLRPAAARPEPTARATSTGLPNASDLLALAAAAIEVRDRTTNPALADRLAAGLTAAGWTTIDPTGTRFDPTLHASVDREPTHDPTLDDTIASVERVGYRDPAGSIVRQPEVVVYRFEPAERPGGVR